MHDIICLRPDQRVSESWTPFLKILQIHNRERLCLKPLSQFSSHPNETCYIKSLWKVDFHHILVWALTYGFQSYAPFYNSNISIILKVCVLNFFHSFQIIPMKLGTSNPHEVATCIIYFLWGLKQQIQSYLPFFKCAYREGVSIFFHSFQVNNMISFILAYRLWQSEKVEYLPQWIIALFFFLTSKPIFQNSNLQYTTSFWAVWKWSMSLLKQLKSRSFRGLLVPCSPEQGFALDPAWALQPPWPQHHFQVLKLDQLSALYDENEWCMLTSQTHPSQVHLLILWLNLSWSIGSLSKYNYIYIIVDEKV